MEKTQTPFFSFPGSEIGLGWLIVQNDPEIIWHNGGTGGYRSFIGFDKEGQKAVVVLSNLAREGDYIENIGLHILDPNTFELKTPKKPVEVDTSIYDDYVGEYELFPGVTITISREGDRLFEMEGDEKVEIFPLSETRYFYKGIDAEIIFLRDENGQVNELVLYLGGEEYHVQRIDRE